MPRYLVMINGREFDVGIMQHDDDYVVSVNGDRSSVRSQVLGPSRSLLFIDDEVLEVDVRQNSEPNSRLVFIRGIEIEATIEEYNIGRLRRLVASSKSSSSQMRLLAPMPGLIVSVDAKPGDTISAGQQLVVIEAMKMENVIKAKSSGRLKTVHVEAGQVVEKGATLMEFE